jgi:stage III sporulation protein SpoIIIAA
MKRLKKGVLKILRKIEYYNIRKANEKKATSKKSINNTYLFILSPPFCGSTLLNEIISSSDNVSVNHTFGTREGQTLPK